MDRPPADETGPRTLPTLDSITLDAENVEQIRKSDLNLGDWVVVHTRNSVYTLCRLDEKRFSVSGGWFDQQELSPHPVTVSGCTWGGSAIKEDIVAAPGLRLEFGNHVMTSCIRQARVLRAGASSTVH